MTYDKWIADITVLNPPFAIREWLTKPYILSQALKRIYPNFTVSVLDQGYRQAFPEECQLLNIVNELPLVRHVLLKDNEQPLTCGRVVIPKSAASHIPELDVLGTNLLGETLLYPNPNVRRSVFEFAHLLASPLISQLATWIPLFPKKDLWARRSVFYIKSAPLLVTDIFLSPLAPMSLHE